MVQILRKNYIEEKLILKSDSHEPNLSGSENELIYATVAAAGDYSNASGS